MKKIALSDKEIKYLRDLLEKQAQDPVTELLLWKLNFYQKRASQMKGSE